MSKVRIVLLSPMSFLPSDNHTLAINLWPSPYNTIIERCCHVSDLQQWECFPISLDHLVEWATIAMLPSSVDNSCDRILVYKTLPTSDADAVLYPISVWLFGFLEDFCLGDYSDWKGCVLKKISCGNDRLIIFLMIIVIRVAQNMLFNHSHWHLEDMPLLGKINSIASTWHARLPVACSSYLSPNFNLTIDYICKEAYSQE